MLITTLMSYISYIKQPALIQEPATCVLNFDETEVTVKNPETENEEQAYTYESVRISKSDFNYPGIVNAIIRMKYSESQVEAIILNGNDTPDHKAELEALQAWRAHAKQVAHSYVG